MKKRAPSVQVSANGDKSPPRKRAFLRGPGDFSSFILSSSCCVRKYERRSAPPQGTIATRRGGGNRVIVTFYFIFFSFFLFFVPLFSFSFSSSSSSFSFSFGWEFEGNVIRSLEERSLSNLDVVVFRYIFFFLSICNFSIYFLHKTL